MVGDHDHSSTNHTPERSVGLGVLARPSPLCWLRSRGPECACGRGAREHASIMTAMIRHTEAGTVSGPEADIRGSWPGERSGVSGTAGRASIAGWPTEVHSQKG